MIKPRLLRSARAALAAACLSLAALPGHANGPEEGLRAARILPGWVEADGRRIVALELDLAEGWKTYWRSPGEMGLPPRFDWTGSGNLVRAEPLWPEPTIFPSRLGDVIGYKGEVILPIALQPAEPGAPIELDALVEIGVCAEVCVPVSMHLAARLDGHGASDPRIRAALADRPARIAADARCRIDAAGRDLALTAAIAAPDLGGEETAIVETGDPHLYAIGTESERRGGTLHVRSTLAGGTAGVNRGALRFTLVGAGGAVEILGCTAN
ncbi:protein-disulfide reductase DsbD domain-containing protein [Tropicimonas sp. IMCC34011]|uniref:protein-disulfide reductase DsbD domain-containing protein n=1 Tax=Tropicimonas sp. IMCC34011 TaxID=2248759 RepID=UPI000E21EE53|nr:protein-disulfide reductase DsbD domain-containing protein [Tropicimonas sp. IMCC34011]